MDNLEQENKKLQSELKIYKIKALKEKIVLVGVLMLVIAEVIFLFSLVKNSSLFSKNSKPIEPFIATIHINQAITTEYIHKIVNKIEKVKENKNLKEFLVIINSPGGSPSASDEMNAYLKELNRYKKVNLYVESMAASGAYYIATAIKPIVSNRNAVVGSIGVIMPHIVIKKLADKIGIESDNISVGKYKEPISAFEKASPQQKEYLNKNLLNPTYENFLEVVSNDRNISIKELKKYADGKIFIANQVKSILVDEISTLVEYKKSIKTRVSKELNIENKKITFVELDFEDKKFPFLNVKVESDTLKEFGNYILK
jgi:protease-4